MGLYSRHIFPRLMDWVMSRQAFQRLRADLLQDTRGEVLEIGFGTGLNLAHYPASVSTLSVVDPADLLPDRVRKRIAMVSFPVRTTQVTAEALPYANQQFDRVVSTWTLCTIPDPVQALREIARVLKPEGTLLFLEHGRSDDRPLAAWQDRLNPIQNVIGCGCHLNRPIDQLIIQAGLRIAHLDRFLLPGTPRVAGVMYRGRATSFPAC
ncbi:MAG: class I SAM-dependent methyltransferase [Nitrospira sp.]|nr:class I SAM-dependent methyltransferase [Nitrospira sp.]MBH0181330.1 class I SAM-dependent methyltransferase [Nitrospira sp.]MBH0185865.1 class I SAM-dependent methyltransferase [Nitrospira sp.]